MDAYDADVLIYAAVADHPLGRRVRALFPADPVEGTDEIAGVGSVVLIPELLTKPLREGSSTELDELGALLARLDLRPLDAATAQLATALGARPTGFGQPTLFIWPPPWERAPTVSSPTTRETSPS